MIVIRVQHSIGPFDRDNTISVSSYIHPLKKNNIISFIIHSYVVQNVSKIEKFCFRLVCLLFIIISIYTKRKCVRHVYFAICTWIPLLLSPAVPETFVERSNSSQ